MTEPTLPKFLHVNAVIDLTEEELERYVEERRLVMTEIPSNYLRLQKYAVPVPTIGGSIKVILGTLVLNTTYDKPEGKKELATRIAERKLNERFIGVMLLDDIGSDLDNFELEEY